MNIDYFVTFGFFDLEEKESIRHYLNSTFGLVFTHRQSDYIGRYLISENNFFDRCTIEENYVEFLEGYKEEKHSIYKGLVKFSIIEGKQDDKMKRRDQLLLEINLNYPNLHLIRSSELS